MIPKKTINKLKQDSYKILRKIRKKSKEKRIEYLNGLAEKYAAENNMSKHKAIQELLSHEELREMYGHIRISIHEARQPQLLEIWKKTTKVRRLLCLTMRK